MQLQRCDDWETMPVAALNAVCQGATLTFRAVVTPAGGCSVVWQDEAGQVIGSGTEWSYAFPTSQTISAMCQGTAQQQSASIIIIENPKITSEQVLAQKTTTCAIPVERCILGYVCKNIVDISISACLGNKDGNQL